MTKNKYSKDEKIAILKLYHEGKHSLKEIAEIFSVNRRTIVDWQANYLSLGEAGLESTSKWNIYTKDIKLAAVRDYLSNQFSLREVTRKYKISSQSVLRNWIRKYTSHSELKDSSKGMDQIAGISRAAYYKWLNRTPSNREVENEEILKSIQLLYQQVDGIYGYRLVTLTINHQRTENTQSQIN